MRAPIDHRPFPPPSRPWIMHQRWNDFLLMHWPVPVEALRAVVPPELPVQTWEGTGWLGIVPFHMSNVRPRLVPPIPGFSSFPELNVRTYVEVDGVGGVFFLSLDAHNRLAVEAARAWYDLPYFQARMAWRREGAAVTYESHRVDRRGPPATLRCRYRPTGSPRPAAPGTFEYWLAERYCLYTVDRRGRPWRTDVHHGPWPLQPAEVDLEVNTLAAAHGLALPEVAPHLRYASHVDVVVWHPKQVS